MLTGDWKDRYRRIFEDGQAIGIRLSFGVGWRGDDVEFLKSLPGLRSVEIYNWRITDLSPLCLHDELEHIGLECRFGKFDFAQFQNLSHCGVKWRLSARTLLDCEKLVHLNVSGYPYEDLSSLHRQSNLQRLHIQSRKLTSLCGVDDLPHLQELTFAYCPFLTDISSLQHAKEIRRLEFLSCKGIEDIKVAGALDHLEILSIENGDQVLSVKPLSGCSALRELYLIGTGVVDGDLSPLLEIDNLEKVAVADRRHHSHTSGEINNLLTRS